MQPATLLTKREGSGPFITFYDDATGERVELSGTTTLNWVAKVTALLREELWLEPGSEVCVDLPLHWQTAVITLATWCAGGLPVSSGGAVAFVSAAGKSSAEQTVALSLRPLGGPVQSVLPRGWQDFALVVPGMSDYLDAVTPPIEVALTQELPSGARVLSTIWDPQLALLAPLASNGSVVLVRNPGDDLSDLAASERVTHTLGCSVTGLPRLA